MGKRKHSHDTKIVIKYYQLFKKIKFQNPILTEQPVMVITMKEEISLKKYTKTYLQLRMPLLEHSSSPELTPYPQPFLPY